MILDYNQYITEYGTSEDNSLSKLRYGRKSCPFCKNGVVNKVYYKHNDIMPLGSYIISCEYEYVYQCSCGWWQQSYTLDRSYEQEFVSMDLTQAILRKYDLSSNEIPMDILNNYIRKNPSKIFNINHKKMEELTADVFKDFYNCEVRVVGKSHDGGKDLILIDGDKQTFVQVKRRTNLEKIEAVTGIRELLGASLLGGADSCIYVTTANRFSRMAKASAKEAVTKNIIDSFELIDYQSFIDILNLRKDNLPNAWINLLKTT